MNKTSDNIPVVDVKGLTGNDEDKKYMAVGIRDAFTNIGFVVLTNHNISTEAVFFNQYGVLVYCI